MAGAARGTLGRAEDWPPAQAHPGVPVLGTRLSARGLPTAFGAKGSFPFEVTSENTSAARVPLPGRAVRVPPQFWSLPESGALLCHPSHCGFAVKNPFPALAHSVCPAKIHELSLGSRKNWHPKRGGLGKLCQLPAPHTGVWSPSASWPLAAGTLRPFSGCSKGNTLLRQCREPTCFSAPLPTAASGAEL